MHRLNVENFTGGNGVRPHSQYGGWSASLQPSPNPPLWNRVASDVMWIIPRVDWSAKVTCAVCPRDMTSWVTLWRYGHRCCWLRQSFEDDIDGRDAATTGDSVKPICGRSVTALLVPMNIHAGRSAPTARRRAVRIGFVVRRSASVYQRAGATYSWRNSWSCEVRLSLYVRNSFSSSWRRLVVTQQQVICSRWRAHQSGRHARDDQHDDTDSSCSTHGVFDFITGEITSGTELHIAPPSDYLF